MANEFFCMTLAKAVGLKVSAVDRRTVGDKPCLIVQRYDRTVGADGAVTRLHQEDFCQALGFPPEHKYQQEGGPLLRDCLALLREWSTTPVLDIRDFLDGQIFNVLIGNADAHGKNYSMLYSGGQRRLAPFYDLVCTLAWPELSKRPAMKIGGGRFPKRVHRGSLAEDGAGSAAGLAPDPRTDGGALQEDSRNAARPCDARRGQQ